MPEVIDSGKRGVSLLSVPAGTATRLPNSHKIHEGWTFQQNLAGVSHVPRINEAHWLEVANDAAEWAEMTDLLARETWPSE